METRDGMLVIAHRGASFDERENTIAAFELAIAMHADYVELDVQVSADRQLVVFHDLELDRLTALTGPLRRRRAAELAEHGIPTLDQVLEVTRGRIGMMAELKSAWRYRGQDVVRRTVELLDSTDVVVSFEPWALLAARRLRPELRTVQHVGFGVSIRAAARYAWAAGFQDQRVTARGLARAQALGLQTSVYTVNDESRMRDLHAAGVDAIFSDRPDVLRRVIGP